MTGSDESGVAITQWPAEFREEWSKRTWWGKIKFIPALVCLTIIAIGSSPALAVVWGAHYVLKWLPPTYKEDDSHAN